MSAKKKVSIGFDLGTTFSAVAIYDTKINRARVVSDDDMCTVTPSVVAFTDTQQLIGYDALLQIGSNPENTLTEMKRLMGRKFSEECVQEYMARWSFKVVEVEEEPRLQVNYRHEIRNYRPEQICAILLSRLKQLACKELGLNRFASLDAVITVPVNYGDSQRMATLEACKTAGIKPTRIITEPAAAALAYYMQFNEGCEIGALILVFDMGGGTTDVSVLKMGYDNQFEVVACSGNDKLGGEDLDSVLVELCLDHIYEKSKVHLKGHHVAMTRLRRACEQAKWRLGVSQSTEINLDRVGVETLDDFSYEISRATFEALITPILKKAVALVASCLDVAKLKTADLSKVVLAGGSCRVPKLHSMLKEALPGTTLNLSMTDNEAIAMGAALQAASDNGLLKLQLKERLPWSLGIEVEGYKTTKVYEKNALIPGKRNEEFGTAHDYQKAANFKIYEGENVLSKDNRFLGSMLMTGLRQGKSGQYPFHVTFELDTSGLLKATAVEKVSGKTIRVTVQRYKKELTEEKIISLRGGGYSESAHSMLSKLAEQLNELEMNVCKGEKLSESQSSVINMEAKILRVWLKENPNPSIQLFNEKLENMRKILKFCCEISDTGEVQLKANNPSENPEPAQNSDNPEPVQDSDKPEPVNPSDNPEPQQKSDNPKLVTPEAARKSDKPESAKKTDVPEHGEISGNPERDTNSDKPPPAKLRRTQRITKPRTRQD